MRITCNAYNLELATTLDLADVALQFFFFWPLKPVHFEATTLCQVEPDFTGCT